MGCRPRSLTVDQSSKQNKGYTCCKWDSSVRGATAPPPTARAARRLLFLRACLWRLFPLLAWGRPGRDGAALSASGASLWAVCCCWLLLAWRDLLLVTRGRLVLLPGLEESLNGGGRHVRGWACLPSPTPSAPRRPRGRRAGAALPALRQSWTPEPQGTPAAAAARCCPSPGACL